MPTAEQAKLQWCPMVRVANIGQVYNRVDPVYLSYQAGNDRAYFERQKENCNCIANECMMWRWGTYIAPPLNAEPGKIVFGVSHQADWGFCGLAGNTEWAS
jgi:hypothetical protein